MSQEKYISSREGASLLGVDRQSFFYYAQSKNVRRREVNYGGKDRYEYSYDDLLAIKDEVQARRASRKHSIKVVEDRAEELENGHAMTDWATREDLPYIYALDCEIYGIEYSVPPTKTVHWWEKNKTSIRVLYNAENRRDVWGCITLLPMEEETIFDILRGDLSEQEIEEKHILTYQPGNAYSCYVTSCLIRPEKRRFFSHLFNSVMNYWCEHPEVHISKLYGFAVGASDDTPEENDGMRLIKKLYFSPRYDISENAWELDLNRYNPSVSIQKFQKCLRSKQGK